MNGASKPHEIGAGPRIGGKELVRKEVAFQLITTNARENDVAGMVSAAVREGMHVIERRRLEVQRRSAVDAAAATVTHGRTLDGALESGSAKMGDPGTFGAAEAGSGKHDAVTLPSNGHFTSQ